MNAKELNILLLLRDCGGEEYGLELVDKSGNLLSKGTIYVYLRNLEDKCLISSRKEDREEDARGLARRLYKISDKGISTLEIKELLDEALETLNYYTPYLQIIPEVQEPNCTRLFQTKINITWYLDKMV